jgi:hypothetical protein
VDERAEQLLAGGEVAVDRPDPDARALGDLGHRHLLPIAPDEVGGGVQDSIAVPERVLTGPARDGL